MSTLFFGNGLNLLNGYSTWNDLLVRIDDHKDKERIPNTFQYEAEILALPEKEDNEIIYNGDAVLYNGQKVVNRYVSESELKKKIANAMQGYHGNEVYERMAFLPGITHYLTTNYDQVFCNTLTKQGYTEYEHVKIENVYSLRRRHSLRNAVQSKKHIWNIHGEIAFPQTIMLGLHQYCGSVGKISDLMNGKYSYTVDKREETVRPLRDRLNDPEKVPFSWIDLFFTTDVYILGFGLQYEETDIWWLLTRRKRMIRQGLKILNKVYYMASVTPGKRELLNSLDVLVVDPPREYVEKQDFRAQYLWSLDYIEKYR